ncbi:hypothetical protein NG798_18465 [Ancylothrix sp. C2]|uniref:hypothetical protein n=1 Tax=Ancylothrix sp. D3o TaxID=2953691 RepID=UPI0021BAA5F9|nr:hypothetical protein [Ancylothrix sp. D3o]MCT7951790.1 hypothetical protein [Ancylothrix sp. D3o]
MPLQIVDKNPQPSKKDKPIFNAPEPRKFGLFATIINIKPHFIPTAKVKGISNLGIKHLKSKRVENQQQDLDGVHQQAKNSLFLPHKKYGWCRGLPAGRIFYFPACC